MLDNYIWASGPAPCLISSIPTRCTSAVSVRWVGVCLRRWGPKCAQPDRLVLCFTGDGGIWYHLLELETAVRCGIQMVTVVNNNHSLNQEQAVVDVKTHLDGIAPKAWTPA